MLNRQPGLLLPQGGAGFFAFPLAKILAMQSSDQCAANATASLKTSSGRRYRVGCTNFFRSVSSKKAAGLSEQEGRGK